MNFDLTEDQKLLVETVQKFAKNESPVSRLRRLRDGDRGWENQVWKQMGELGWLGVMFPESAGGLGMSFVEAGLILEQLGITLVPEPYIPLIVAGAALVQAGNEEQQQRFLAPALAGDESLAFAYVEEQSRHVAHDLETRADKTGGGWRLFGKKRFVLNGHAADHVVVTARTGGGKRDRDGVSLFVIDPGLAGVRLRKLSLMDGKKGALIELDGVELGADRMLGAEGRAAAVVDHVLDYGAAAAVCEGSGIMQTVLWMTRNYLTERKQFGAAIGTFQALQHRAVDMFVETELAKSAAILAMLEVEQTDADRRQRAISAAKVQLAESGGFVGRQAIQLHGGIGVTDEHDVGLFFKRLHVLSTIFGDELHHTERFASLPSFTRHVQAS
jgi:alkylation response protein AidB-like acyl-CoA dehydrogenase